jgi:hypothetical protein
MGAPPFEAARYAQRRHRRQYARCLAVSGLDFSLRKLVDPHQAALAPEGELLFFCNRNARMTKAETAS